MNDAKACAVTGGSVMLAMLALILFVFGWVALLFTLLAAFGFLMLCVGVDAVNRFKNEETAS